MKKRPPGSDPVVKSRKVSERVGSHRQRKTRRVPPPGLFKRILSVSILARPLESPVPIGDGTPQLSEVQDSRSGDVDRS